MLLSTNAYSFELIAHRGICGNAKENTIGAIRNSWEIGASAVEVDVRISKDKVLFLYHDDEINDQKIKDLPFQSILELEKNIDKLESIFSLGVPEGYYILDLKDNSGVFAKQIESLFVSSNFPMNKIAFQSQDVNLLKSIRGVFPKSQFILITKLKRNLPWLMKPSHAKLIRTLQDNQISIVSIKGRSFIDKNYIKNFKDRKIKVFVWTINDFSRIDYYKHIGVDGVITDKFAEYIKVLQG